MNRKALGLCIFGWMFGLVGMARAEVGADLWTWLDVTVWQEGPTRVHLFGHQAVGETAGVTVQLISPRVKYRPTDWLELGAGLSTLRIRNLFTGEFAPQLRPELEVSPLFDFGKNWHLHWRNRMESRWDDFGGKPRPRLRHRFQFSRDMTGLGALKTFYLSNEWLIEFDRSDWVENRLVPAGLTFRLADWAHLDFFYMYRSFRFDDGWRSDQIAGVFLKLRL